MDILGVNGSMNVKFLLCFTNFKITSRLFRAFPSNFDFEVLF